jgi:ribosomal-protein-alanine N-acetyltransferase
MRTGQDTAPVVFTSMEIARDLTRVLELEAVSFSRPWTRDMFVKALDRSPGTTAVVARSASGLVTAYCMGQIVLDELHIHVLAVDPHWRERGLGRRLLAFVLRGAARQGATAATLEVRRSNIAAQRLYEGAGFRQSGIRRGYYPDPTEDALVYWRDGLDSV